MISHDWGGREGAFVGSLDGFDVGEDEGSLVGFRVGEEVGSSETKSLKHSHATG